MTKAFYVREDCTLTKWVIAFNTDLVPAGIDFKGSYNVVAARVLGLFYPDYLRYCAANGATLKGKEGYSFAVFKEKKDAERIVSELNKNWDRLAEDLG